MVRNKKEKSYIGSALTLAEVANILKISTKLASRLVREGKLDGVKVGREYRIAGSNLHRFLCGKKKECVVTVTSNPQDWTLPENCGIVCATKTGTEG